MNAEKAKAHLATYRAERMRELALCDRAENIVARLPEEHIWRAAISSERLVLYFYPDDSRETLQSVMAALSAGEWKKDLHHEGQSINYSATIDEVPVVLWDAPAPPSCKIINETVHVPAHDETRRKLICQ